jgi:O-antigen/teichoic acid export membrane protein
VKPGGLLSSSLIYGAGAVANRLAALLLLPVFTAYLTPADYGVVGLLATLGMFLTPVFSFGLGSSIGISYFASAGSDAREKVIKSAFAIMLLSAVCMAFLAAALKDTISSWMFSSTEFTPHVLVTILGVGFSLLVIPLQLRLQFEQRPVAFVNVSLIGLAGSLGTSYWMVAHREAGAIGLLAGAALGQGLTLAACGFCGFRFPRLKDLVSPIAKDLLVIGLPMIPSFFLLFFLQNAVRWPLEWQAGLHDVGLFTIGTNIGLAITVFCGGVVAAWLPHALSKAHEWEERRHELAQSFTRYFAVAGYLVLLFFVGSQPVMKLFVADAFFPAWTVVGLAALAQFLISLYSMVLPPLYIAKKVRLVLISQAIAALVTAMLMPWLVSFGMAGAALVVVVGALILVMITSWVIHWAATDVLPIPYNAGTLSGLALVISAGAGLSFALDIGDLPGFCIGAGAILSASAFVVIRITGLPVTLLSRIPR